MILPGHLAGGYIATNILLSVSHAVFPVEQNLALYIVGTISGIIPDIDQIYFYFEHKSAKKQKTDNHRDYFSHTPIVWIAVGLLISIVGIVDGSIFAKYIGLVVIVGTLSHLILDTIEYGIMWLWPISKKKHYFFTTKDGEVINARKGTIEYHTKYILKNYLFSKSFIIEIVISLFVIWMILGK